jgi:transmembrane sensor
MNSAMDIEAQAAAWLARRDARSSEEPDADFTLWLAADPRHRAAYLRLAAAWERTARLKVLRPEGNTIDPDHLARRAPGRSYWPRGGLWAFAATLAALALGVIWWQQQFGEESYRTEVGGLSRVVLKDGSTVTLNTDTELRVRFSKSRREIALLRGEAQFNVTHDLFRPFEVLAGGRLVRAVGTAFDVRYQPNQALQVLVTEGRVAFLDASQMTASADADPQTATISAGESAVAGGGKISVRRVNATEASRQLAWQVGQLSFQGETLAEAVSEFNRYNRRKLVIDDPAIANLQIGGSFQALEVDSFVAALARSFGITAYPRRDNTLVLGRGGGSPQP